LTLVACTVAVESECHVVLAKILICKRDTCADRDLSANNTVATVEAGREHVHRASLSVRDTLSLAQELANDRPNGTSSHHGESMTSVGGNEMVLLGDGVFDADGDSFLARGKMAETTNLLLLVQPVC